MQDTFSGLPSLLHQLADQEIQRVLVEGGPTTVHRFLEAGLVDEVFLVHSNVVHQRPVPSNLDEDILREAGLTREADYVWGDERVAYFVKQTSEA